MMYHARLQARIDRFALQREDAEDALVDTPERLPANEPLPASRRPARTPAAPATASPRARRHRASPRPLRCPPGPAGTSPALRVGPKARVLLGAYTKLERGR